MATTSEPSSAAQLALHVSNSLAGARAPMPVTSLSNHNDDSEHKETRAENATRHETYYIPSGDVVFQVESTLFRVHRYFFERESTLFRDMLSLPTPNSDPDTGADGMQAPMRQLEGMTDKNPINLPQLSSDDFARFLWIFYNPTFNQYDAPISTWTSILRLAHRWDFPSIRALAFCELEGAPPVTRLALGERYEAPAGWRARAMTELITRHEPLNASEGEELGMTLVLKIAEMRENTRGGRHGRGWRTDWYGDYYRGSRSRSPRRVRTLRSRSPSPVVIPPQPPIIIPAPAPAYPPSPPFIIQPPIALTVQPWNTEPHDIVSVLDMNGGNRTWRRWRLKAKRMLRRFF